ncbi:MAG: rhomboid family intramembrane serine protease [Thiolinea sp.]
MNLARIDTPVTYLLIALCVLAFLPVANNLLPTQNAFALYLPANPLYQPWQYLSSLFMHGGLTHLLFNMLALWMFGSALERWWGSLRFLVFYLLCGIGAGLIYTWINEYQFNQLYQQIRNLGVSAAGIEMILEQATYPANLPGLTEALVGEFYTLYHAPVVGASGAIYGILAAYALCFPNNRLMLIFLPYPIPAKYFVPVLLLIDLLSGLTGFSIFGGNIAHFAHVGGAIVGFALTFVLGRKMG